MRIYSSLLVCAAILLAASGCGKRKQAAAVHSDVAPGSETSVRFTAITGIRLARPESPEESGYLGLSDGPEFALSDVKGPVLLVQLFDMYCTNCQKDAPEVNRLYQRVQEAGLADKVRFVGIGKGNTQTEADIFRERYGVPFPLFPDPEKTNTKILGEERTPYFVIVDLTDKQVVHGQWRIGSSEEMLGRIRAATQ